MGENLYCKEQKTSNDKYREKFDNIKWEDGRGKHRHKERCENCTCEKE